MDSLKEIIVRIARPLEYANKSGTHGLSALKYLGRFVSQQVLTVLGHSVHPPRVEADLLHLVHLFSDYETLGPDLRGRRIAEARAVLDRLLRTVEEAATSSCGPVKPAHRLWELPIQYVRGVGAMKAGRRCGPSGVSSPGRRRSSPSRSGPSSLRSPPASAGNWSKRRRWTRPGAWTLCGSTKPISRTPSEPASI